MSDKYLGKTLGGRYEVREIIGTGGMAVVYKAYCTVLHRYVAIKVLKDEFASDDEFRKRFYNEAQAVAKLSHNNIVSIYDVSQGESGAEYIVMELCEGVTLKDYLRKKHHLSWQETVYFAQQVGRALAHAHSRGIIHQDIKPQNIMLLRDGTAKVMDFGIASFANSQETRKMSEAIGSVHYISPEQAKGSAVDYRTDLYSLGVVMYEMLTGTLPFRGDTAVAVVMQHINTVPPKPGELVDDIPPAMNEIVMHAMCASAAQRYGSAMELCNDLERVRNNPNLYLNYTNRAAAVDFDATRAIRYDDVDEEATQLIRGIPVEPQEPTGYYNNNDAVRQNGRDNYDGYDDYYEDGPSRRKKGGVNKALIGGIVVVLLAVIVFAIKSAFGGSSTKQVEVPNFVGLNYEQDIQNNSKYDEFDISVVLQEETEDSGYTDGEVIDQDPEEGTMVTKGDTVTLTVADLSGDDEQPDDTDVEEPETVAVPSVVGQNYDSAKSALEAVGLQVERKEEHSDSVEKDVVMAVSPNEGTEVEKGSVVTLTVSEGPEKELVDVPDLSGMTQSAAETMLNQFGLSLGDVSKEESDLPVGTVIDQTVSAGEQVEKGTSVGITIAIEPPESDEDLPGSSGGVGFSKDGGTTYIKVSLPSDKDSVYVSVSVGGNTLYGSDTNCSRDSITIRANYSGEEHVVVTVDGETVYDADYDFA
ncbi:MAG: Stk1 family PASTA domain-containing Ser/Thr kinase [Butyricicoccus sp.]